MCCNELYVVFLVATENQYTNCNSFSDSSRNFPKVQYQLHFLGVLVYLCVCVCVWVLIVAYQLRAARSASAPCRHLFSAQVASAYCHINQPICQTELQPKKCSPLAFYVWLCECVMPSGRSIRIRIRMAGWQTGTCSILNVIWVASALSLAAA